MTPAFVLAPFAGWVAAGTIKFAINSARSGRLAWKQIGYGGFPSTHSAIVATTGSLVGLREGWGSAPFGITVTLLLIVALDATGLRRLIGTHADALNRLLERDSERADLRVRVGHRWVEVAGGIAIGSFMGFVLDAIFP